MQTCPQVVFKLELALEEAESASVPDTDEYLPAGSIVIAADDDPGPRLQYQDMIQVVMPNRTLTRTLTSTKT